MVAASNNHWICVIKLQKYTHLINSIIPIKFLLKPILYDSENFKPHYFHCSRCAKLLSKINKIHMHYNHICDCNIDLYSRDQKFPQHLIKTLLISCQMSEDYTHWKSINPDMHLVSYVRFLPDSFILYLYINPLYLIWKLNQCCIVIQCVTSTG